MVCIQNSIGQTGIWKHSSLTIQNEVADKSLFSNNTNDGLPKFFWCTDKLEGFFVIFFIFSIVSIYLNKSWWQHPTRHQLYGHLPPITKTIQVRWTRHAGHCWRSREELISEVLLWTPTYGRAKAGWPAWTYIQQLCEDTGCSPEDLPEVINDREKWRERVRDIRATSTTSWSIY